MKEKIFLEYKGKKILLEVQRCSFLGKFVGLMFSRREKAKVLLFDFGRKPGTGIHSFFVFFEFLAIWLDEKNKVVQLDKVRPWKFFLKPKKTYYRLIEIPINEENKNLIEEFSN